ncbi:MAG: hypothetical protein QW076_04650 [Candidatus Anstonellales archaeon]
MEEEKYKIKIAFSMSKEKEPVEEAKQEYLGEEMVGKSAETEKGRILSQGYPIFEIHTKKRSEKTKKEILDKTYRIFKERNNLYLLYWDRKEKIIKKIYKLIEK